MRRSLEEYVLRGVKTTIPFMKNIMMEQDFRAGHSTRPTWRRIRICTSTKNPKTLRTSCQPSPPQLPPTKGSDLADFPNPFTGPSPTNPRASAERWQRKHKTLSPAVKKSSRVKVAAPRHPASIPIGKADLQIDPAPRKLLVTDVAFRDGHQSLLATRMRTEDMLPIAQKLDAVGYWSLEVWGGATFDTCLRFLKEDPWERLRALRAAMPNTRLQMLLRGQNLVGYRHYADDVLEKFIERSAANGIDVFRIFDALNDVRNLDRAIREVKSNGKHVEAGICYTVSPVHHVDRFITMAKQLEDLGTDTLCIKDMAGLLAPLDAYHLIRRLKSAVRVPIHLHTHYTSGMASMSSLMAILGGLDMLDTAVSPLAGGTSHPPTETLVATLRNTPYDTGLDLRQFETITEHFRTVRRKYRQFESDFTGVDAEILTSQIPAACCPTWRLNWRSRMRSTG